jgi:hypothetical protein
VKLQAKHPLDLPDTLQEWWSVEVSWDTQDKHHLFSTQETALAYATKRVDTLVKARANSKKYLPLVVQWDENTPFCFRRALLGVKVLNTPVFDYSVSVHHEKRDGNTVVSVTSTGELATA